MAKFVEGYPDLPVATTQIEWPTMAEARTPGPVGIASRTDDLNDGTLIRASSPVPGPVGVQKTALSREDKAKEAAAEAAAKGAKVAATPAPAPRVVRSTPAAKAEPKAEPKPAPATTAAPASTGRRIRTTL